MGAFRKFRLVVLAFLAAVLQAGTPALAYAKMAADNGLAQEVCTTGGAKKIMVDAEGTVREAAPDAVHGDSCQLCAGAGTAPIAVLIQLHEIIRHPGAIRSGQSCSRSGAAFTTPPATGPPAGS